MIFLRLILIGRSGKRKAEGMVLSTRIEEVHDRLAAFYPVYTDQGSVTRIVYVDPSAGTECAVDDPRQVTTVVRALARCYAVDLRAQAKLLGKRYGQQLVRHFYLPGSRVLVPFKVRKRRTDSDVAYGYVDLDCIERLAAGDPPSVILRSGTVLPLCCRIKTARHAYYFGQVIKEDLFSSNGPDLTNALHLLQGLFQGSLPAPLARKSTLHGHRFTRRK